MVPQPGKIKPYHRLVALAGFLLVAITILLGLVLRWPLPVMALLALFSLGAAVWMVWRTQEQAAQELAQVQDQLLALEKQHKDDRLRLDILLRLNQGLAQSGSGAIDEQTLMDRALSALTELVGGLGCSFVPVDEWQQPLPPFTHGQLPEPVLRAWAAHLTDGMLRDRCGSCRVLRSTPGGCPLHPGQLGDTMLVKCLPLHRSADSRTVLGVLHIYFPAGRDLDQETLEFLGLFLNGIAAAYESAHLRAQELSTLRQIRLLRAPESDLYASLGSLLEGTKQALEASCIVVRLRKVGEERLDRLTIQAGSLDGLEPILQRVFDRVSHGESDASAPGVLPVWVAQPVCLPGGQVVGMLLAASEQPFVFHPRQQAILQTVAAQAALLVENERLVRSLEYKAVIQERTRLAREIHDGLAQTLAYLKLQAGQMQSYLAQGNLTRLSLVLKENYQTLAEAYLDTRQAIDNLRLTPQDGLAAWIERTLEEFEAITGVEVEISIDPHARARASTIPLEIQAQLVRIVQEALSNVRKHARARKASLALREWQGDLIIELRDDGLGFEADDVPEISRHGLRGMRERAEMIGADFQVISQKQKGTTIRLVLPSILEEPSQ
jgi:two-component system nitrate/nitrite sensor histidine kinase NarX